VETQRVPATSSAAAHALAPSTDELELIGPATAVWAANSESGDPLSELLADPGSIDRSALEHWLPQLVAQYTDRELPNSEFPTREVAGIRFASSVNADNSAARASTTFSPGTARIFAVFPTEELSTDYVTVRWARDGDADALLVQRHPVDSGTANGYVWLRPPQGWEPGSYQVRLYSGDESLSPLAARTYTVASTR
jgi:hypothetical protein